MTKINFKRIDFNVCGSSSGIFNGLNAQSNWRKRGNISEGFGKIEGQRNKIYSNISMKDLEKEESSHGEK